ncbi:hypothetical protein [Nocardia sp. NPDC051570]|uniref:hypothetical protein n=1 Tax=Nocardia sp. NPDC051570 TaxID=3364324 RepID=UPI00379C103B
MDAVTVVPRPANAPVHPYVPGSPERELLVGRLAEISSAVEAAVVTGPVESPTDHRYPRMADR